MGTNAVSDPRTGRLHGFVRLVCIASGCLNLRVTEEFADHWQALAKGQGPGREGVAEIVCVDFGSVGTRQVKRRNGQILLTRTWKANRGVGFELIRLRHDARRSACFGGRS